MPSPFPGMDPYLESHWGDVHQRLVVYGADRLQQELPPNLRSRVEERVFVESAQGADGSVYPDVRVVERPLASAGALPERGGVAVAEPLVLHVEDEPATQGYIQIIDVGSGGRVVTVIEFLSLSNKQAGEGRNLYRQEQRELREGGASLVEVDLLRAGRRPFTIPAERIPASHRTPYQVCVRRGWRPLTVEIYRVPVRERLPVIRIPLREGDEDAPLDLQALIDEAYLKGRYDDTDYRQDPDPPLTREDAAWADALLREKGLR